MRYAAIKTNDIDNGPGIRVSLWTQGCPFRCPECHNPETHDFNGGKEWTKKEMDLLIRELSKGQNLSILGGEPLIDQNLYTLKRILTEVREKFAFINIWLWTGFKFEDVKDLELIKMVDVIVDGKFEIDFLEKGKLYGSNNQRIIDVKKSLNYNKICLYEKEK